MPLAKQPLLFLIISACCILSLYCDRSAAPSVPIWWERAADTTIPRLALLGQPLIRAKSAETGLYYEDSMGCTFQYTPPSGGALWVEYYTDSGYIRALTLLWESNDFSQMTGLYQQLRKAYTQRFGTPRGTIGDLEWLVSDTLRINLRLSPERRYLHGSFSVPGRDT